MAYQIGIATFTGVEPYVDLTWSVHYAGFALLGSGAVTTDGSIVPVRLTNPSNPALPPDNTAVRVEPDTLFSGTVTIINLQTA